MREVFEEIDVRVGPNGAPLILKWRGRTLRVHDVLDSWRAGGEWWAGRYPRDYWFVTCGTLVVEVYREDRREVLPGFEGSDGEPWVLARVVD